ncbi:mitochondrial distribution and morphology protein 12 [Scheffersomyces xylosifermentans]|uniref:mitochondrial distribution and morphology protein 12 n=1 Tax=Scheffersomyces xylosifermentans TaxID=1304137 RepID=UPI00315D7E6B
MSFDINWDQLVADNAINESIKDFLDHQFQNISLPSYISNLSVTNFSLGEIPPEITIRHIGDPFDEFYEDEAENSTGSAERTVPTPNDAHYISSEEEDDDDDHENDLSTISENSHMNTFDRNVNSFMHESSPPRRASPTPPLPPIIRSRTASDSFSLIMGNTNLNYLYNYSMNNIGLGHTTSGTETPTNILNQNALRNAKINQRIQSMQKSSRGENDIQLIAEILYKGDLHLDIVVNLLVNYPSPNFISLPIKLHITDLVVHSIATIAYLKKSVFFSFLCDINESTPDYFTTNSSTVNATDTPLTHSSGGNFVDYVTDPNNRERIDIIKKIKIESEIGEAENNVLRNVGKVEKFLIEQLRTIIREELAWPGWICIDMNDHPEEEEAHTGNTETRDPNISSANVNIR